MTRTRRIAAIAAVLLPLLAGSAWGATYPAGFEDRPVVSGLTQAIAMDWTPDGRMFVAEKQGLLKVVPAGGSAAVTVLDISDHVNSAGDRGLEGIAVDSDFANNGFVYLAYVYDVNPLMRDSDFQMVSRLTRIKINPNGTVANPSAPETVILGTDTGGACPAPSNTTDCMPSDSTSHMIGTVRSAPDGTLWVGHGDGAGFAAVEPTALRALDERSLAGKILHVDRNGRGLPGHAFCPGVSDLTQNCTKVHAKGFRNPFRFHLRPNGEISAGEVGWNTTEEINLIPEAGKSYGWPCYEGRVRTPGYADLAQCADFYSREGTFEAETPPAYDYARDQGSAVIGGPTYTGSEYPPGYRDSLFFGDFTAFSLRRLTLNAQGQVSGAQPFATGFVGTDIENGPDGNLWYTSFGTGAPGTAGVLRIVYSPGNGSPHAVAQADRTSGNAPLTVAFQGSASTDPDGDSLTYDWDFGDGSAHSSQANPTHTYTSTGTFTARLTVSDGRGLDSTATVTIASGGSGPIAQIQAPADQSSYRDGDTVQLRGSATDAQDGNLSGSSLHWRVALRHRDHFHPLTEQTGAATSFVARRDHDADSSYEITLTATDSDGLTSARTITIQPEKVDVRIDSTPDGAPVSYGGRGAQAPYTQETAIGYDTTVTATERRTIDGKPFWFTGWSDGGARVHDIRVPDTDFTLRALYEEDKAAARPASASSSFAGLDPGLAVDGKADTRWSSTFADGQHWQVDLGRVRAVDRVYLDWEGAYARRYRILTSVDGQTFTEAATETISAPGARTTMFATRNARYVRVLGLERATQYGISFWEARVLGPADSDDGQPPATTLDSTPPATTSSSTATFRFSSEAGATFECRLDSDEWQECSSPKDHTGLASGAHTFQVRASDTSGATDPTPAEHRWTIDYGANKALGGPATASSSFGPEYVPALANDGNTGSRWSSNFTDGQWWQVDLGQLRTIDKVEIDWEHSYARSYRILTSSNGQTFTEAAADTISRQGPRTTAFPARTTRYLRIEALQRATQYGVSIWEARAYGPSDSPQDTTPPDTAIDSGPSGTVQSTSATFGFSSEAGATFECSLDGGAWSPCVSPRSLTGLSTGDHTFRVRATDAAGNTDQSPASRTWTVQGADTTPPQTTIDSGPSATTSASTATFAFSSEAGATFECKLDSGAWAACTSTKAYSALNSGTHTFSVRAKDAAGNTDQTPAERTWSIDYGENKALNAPATASSTYATGFGPALANDGSAGTRWSSAFSDGQWWQVDLGRARMVDKVEINWEGAYASSYRVLVSSDGQSFTAAATENISAPGYRTTTFSARSARYVRIEALARATQYGVSMWEARVHGPADPTDTTPPDTTITSGPSGTVQPTTATFAFSSEAGATFACSLDGGAYAACTSPRNLTGLSRTQHTFRVRATDSAGNTDPTPAERIWTVQSYADNVRGTTGIFSYYRLGDSGTTAVDDRGQANGSYQNGPTAQASLIAGGDSSRDFDGVNDLVDFSPTPFGAPAAFSVEAWVRVDTTKASGQYHFLVTDALSDFADGFSMVVDSSNRPVFWVARTASSRSSAVGPALTLGQTAHVVAVYTGSALRLYVNGTLRANVAYTGGVTWAAGRDLRLATQFASPSRAARYLDGRLDEVALYRSALTDAQVTSHYNAGR